jgi:uncharacterized membrane protein YtjA (UPF0391 family)
MLRASIFFFLLAVIAGLLGFTTLAGAAAGIAKLFFMLFLIIWGVLLILGIFAAREITGH